MSTAFIFYSHVVLTGVAIAAASWHFAAIIGAPMPRYYPVLSPKGGPGSAVALWLLSGPISLMRLVSRTYYQPWPFSMFSLLALTGSLIWAFCLGVLALELLYRLFFV